MTTSSKLSQRGLHCAAFLAAFCLLALAVYRTAWAAEDAYITFRVVENLWAGFGAVWNVDERVQAYTHPLWFALLVALRTFTYDLYTASLVLSAACIVVTAALWWFAFRGNFACAAVACLLFVSSRSCVDFSTSGLETPLLFLLISAVLGMHFRSAHEARGQRTHGWTEWFAALAFLTRPDSLILLLPILCFRAFSVIRLAGVKAWLMRSSPAVLMVLVWELFSLIYYGSPVPNTALAKLGTGVGLMERVDSGWAYFAWSAAHDLPSVATLLLGVAAALLWGKTEERVAAVAVMLHCFYLCWVGGDFMGGRMLAPAVLVSMLLLVRVVSLGAKWLWLLPAAIVFIAIFTTVEETLFSPVDFTRVGISKTGIADERGFYYRATGYRSVQRRQAGLVPPYPMAEMGRAMQRVGARMAITCNIGMSGFVAGPSIQIVDPLALTDPFLSRLPSRPNARVGHFERSIPPGYFYWRKTGDASELHPAMRSLADDVYLATRAPLGTPGRLEAIGRLVTHSPNAIRTDAYEWRKVGIPGVEEQREQSSSETCLGRSGLFFVVVDIDDSRTVSAKVYSEGGG